MNKKFNISLLAILSIAALAGCGETTTTEPTHEKLEEAVVALSSLKQNSHDVDVIQEVSVKKPDDKMAIDIYSKFQMSYSFGYKGDERSFKSFKSVDSCDLNKETGNPIIGTERHKEEVPALYFKNVDDGTALIESLNINNEVQLEQLAYFNEKKNIYTPIIFDSEFKNPFDFITAYDFVKKEDGSLKLINEKADFIATCYKTVGLNFISDNTVITNENGQIEEIKFVIDDLVGSNFIRSNTLTIKYSNHGYELTHLKPFNNQNPELDQAFKALKDVENFTYDKEFVTSKGVTQDYITGYFTHEQTYFRHHTEQGLEHPYQAGDEYDYKVILNEDNKSYTGLNYVWAGEDTWNWSVIMVSGTSPYIMDTFNDIGPRIGNMNSSIFKKIDNKTYEVESYFLPTIGQYFDYQMLGVSSLVFETSTKKCVVKLNDDNQLDTIETSFYFEGNIQHVNFHLSNIGNTEIPTWAL